jgi:hypothetical protein
MSLAEDDEVVEALLASHYSRDANVAECAATTTFSGQETQSHSGMLAFVSGHKTRSTNESCRGAPFIRR